MSNESIWLVATMATAGGIARLAKKFPSMPKGALPWLTLAVGYLLTLGKLALVDHVAIADAAAQAWYGIGLGLAAVGGHEALRPGLAKAIGEDRATYLLGKLPDSAPPKKKKPSAASIVFVAMLSGVTLTGCPAALQAVAVASQAAGWLTTVLGTASDGADRFYARHPHEQNRAKVTAALERAQAAARALEGTAGAAERQDALAAYLNLRTLLLELGVLDARAPAGGAETEAPEPQPFSLPEADEAKAKIGA